MAFLLEGQVGSRERAGAAKGGDGWDGPSQGTQANCEQ